jgi:predicted nucleotidyltransferase
VKKGFGDNVFNQKLVGALKEALSDNLWGVVLFGSRARGEGKIHSDWDVLILADGVPENPVERMTFIRDVLFKNGITAVSPIIRTRKEFEREQLW